MANNELTVISDCKTCGRCCEGLGVPPFEYDDDGEPFEEGLDDLDLPPDALEQIRDALDQPDWNTKPCCWFDPVTRLCRHYEHRPDACARFAPGNPFCQEILGVAGLQHANPHDW